VAFSQDSIAAALNPAGLAYVGDRLDVEGEFFSPLRQYSVNGEGNPGPGSFPLTPGTTQSHKNYYVIPTVGWSHKLDDKQTLGVVLYGNGGMNTDYVNVTNPVGYPPGTFYGGRAGVDMAQGFLAATYARSFDNGRYALGVSPILAVEYFEAQGLAAFSGFSSNPSQLTNNGREYSFGVGYKVGGQAEIIDGVRLGVAYKSRTYMSQLSNYAGLFTGQGSFDIPSSLDTGLSWAVNNSVTTAFDVQQIFYSEVNSVGNPFSQAVLQSGAQLGAGNGPGFGWKDMTVYKFGAQWKQSDQLTLRGGFSYGHQPIPNSQVLLNILAPAVQEWHLDGGLSYKLPNQDELSFAFMYSPQSSVSGPNPLNPGQNIALSMTQYSLQVGWSRRF